MVQFPNQITQSVIIRDANGNIIINIGPTVTGAAIFVTAPPPSLSQIELTVNGQDAEMLIQNQAGNGFTIVASGAPSLDFFQTSASPSTGCQFSIVKSSGTVPDGAIVLMARDPVGNPAVILDGFDGYIKKGTKAGATVTIETFQVLTLQNGWTQWGAGFANLSVRRLGTACAHLEGTIRPGTTTDGTLITTLAAGYAPVTGIQRIPVMPIGYFDIDTSGNVVLHAAAGTASVSVCADFTIVGFPN